MAACPLPCLGRFRIMGAWACRPGLPVSGSCLTLASPRGAIIVSLPCDGEPGWPVGLAPAASARLPWATCFGLVAQLVRAHA